MTQAKQPEVIELAEFFDRMQKSSHRWHDGMPVHKKTAAVLRTLHDRIAEQEATHMRELTAYRTTVQNQDAELSALRARCAEMEEQNKALSAEAHENKLAVRWARERIAELEQPQAALAAVPERGEVLVTVSGFTGSGKSAIAGEIEIMCRALGVPVEWVDGMSEKNLTGADWTAALELYKPRVRIVEVNLPTTKAKNEN